MPDIWKYSRGVRQALAVALLGVKEVRRPSAGFVNATKIFFHPHHIENYVDGIMKNSVFCLCPQGWAAWSPRIYVAIFSGCLPVLFEMENFTMALPFDDVVDWNSFLVRVPADRAGEVVEIVQSYDAETVCRMQSAMREWAPFLDWCFEPRLPLLLLLDRVWRKRLERFD